MTALTPAAIASAVSRVSRRLDAAEAALNHADAQLGDGDTGTMLKRLTRALAEADIASVPDCATAFQKLAVAASASTGSSLGTLVMTALMSFSRDSRTADDLSLADMPRFIVGASAAMLARGKAQPGDKTVIDGLLAVAEATGRARPAEIPLAARDASRTALALFRDQPNKIGRAGRYGDRSRGLDDPGMLALAVVCEALATET